MNDKNRRISILATRMSGFGAAHAADFPAETIGGQRFSSLNVLVTKIDEFGSKQVQERGSAKAVTETKSVLREEIRGRMRAMRETAVSVEGQQPGISQKFNLPTSQSDESLIEAARAFVAAATPLKPLFLSREMPEDFLEKLIAAIESFEEAVNEHNSHKGSRSAAGILLDNACSEVITLRRELDPIVRNKYRDNPEKLTLWETASHLEKRSRKGAADELNVTPPPTTGGQT